MPALASGPRFHGEPPLFLTSGLLAQTGLPHLFSTRHLPGVRPFRDPAGPFDPRALHVFGTRGMAGEPVAFLKQVHGAGVVAAEQGGSAGEADILTTGRPGLPLAIFTADCLPIIVYDPRRHRLAMAHAGWRGLAAGVLENTVDSMRRVGAGPLRAWLGPAIGPGRFEVGAPVLQAFSEHLADANAAFVPIAGQPGKYLADIYRLARLVLAQAGVDRIGGAEFCTVSDQRRFYSYRRDQTTGRMATLIWIK